MPLTAVDKMKINKYLRNHAIGDIFYQDMCDELGKREPVKDVEFLEYFTNQILSEFEKDTKIQSKQISKILSVIEAFLGWIHEDGKETPEEIIDKIRSFNELYDEYLKRTESVKDEELIGKYLESLTETLNNLHPQQTNNESVSKYIKKVSELEQTIKKLEREIEELNKLKESSQKTLTQKQERIETLSHDLVEANNEVNGNNKKIAELEATIKELTSQISKLEQDLTSSRLEIDVLTPLKEQCAALTEQVSELTKTIEKEEKKQKKQEKLEIKESKIESLIYKKLIQENASIEELVAFIKTSGTTTDTKQVAELLRRMRKEITIENSLFQMQPSYRIVPPKVDIDGSFNIGIPSDTKHYDILLVSDFHLEQFDSKTMAGFDEINDYCVRNGINLILNLGDFFHGNGKTDASYAHAIDNYKLVEEAIEKIPTAENVYHAILGGNHDKNLTNYGFDPITMLSDAREDIISLGYNHSTVNISTPIDLACSFDLHHPETFAFPIELTEDGIDPDDINTYLNKIYRRSRRDRSESYVDIFGHTHKSQFNPADSYLFVPSLFGNKTKKGAVHLRVYIDELSKTKYMVFMPLSYNSVNKLYKNNELIYKKQLSR